MSKETNYRTYNIQPGVDTDRTRFASQQWTFSRGIRFVNGLAQKVGGFVAVNPVSAITSVMGSFIRSIYSQRIGANIFTLLGTPSNLYSLVGSSLTNITPLDTTTHAIAASLETIYGTLPNDPLTTTNGYAFVSINQDLASPAFAVANLKVGDTLTLSGAATTNNIPNTEINAAHTIKSHPNGSGTLGFATTTAANATGAGGGASVVLKTGFISIAAASAYGIAGNRIKLAGAADTGGIVAATYINKEHIVRAVVSTALLINTGSVATSHASGGGGAGVTIQAEIADGTTDESFGQGFGLGKFGVGRFGVSKNSTAGRARPRFWFYDRFGDLIILTPGNQTGVYSWDGVTTAAPALVSGAPTAVTYAFVSDEILVTLGAQGVKNRIKASDQGDITNWTSSSTNHVFTDDIEAANEFLSHAPLSSINLLFCENQTWTFRFIGLPDVWEIKLKDPKVGIVAPLARIVVGGVAYWMGQKNFYMWRGGNVEKIPSNLYPESSIRKYVFDDLDQSQKSKCYAEYNEEFDEIEFHYPSLEDGTGECTRIARVCLKDWVWTPDQQARTAAEVPNVLGAYPKKANGSTLYHHENGTTLDAAWELISNLQLSQGMKTKEQIQAVIPDSAQTGSLTLTVESFAFPQAETALKSADYTITPTTERMPIDVAGRLFQFTLAEVVSDGSDWEMGGWMTEVKPEAPD